MYEGQLRTVVAGIVLIGHFLVFFFSMALGLFGPLQGTDLLQVVLIASPVLGMTATAAFRFVLDGQYGVKKGKKTSAIFSTVSIVYPVLLLACIFALFYGTHRMYVGFGPDNLKIYLGAIETFFGMYLGLLSDKLFGKLDPSH